MIGKRVPRLNSLLKEVLSEVLTKDLHHLSGLPQFVSITQVEITSDLSFAKVYVSIIGSEPVKSEGLRCLNTHAGQIAYAASKKVRLRQFPRLTFSIDEGLEKQLRIHEILDKVQHKPEA